ncbi:MAG: hypothetical protein ABIV51_11795 [Saprospiraceae bacterium]
MFSQSLIQKLLLGYADQQAANAALEHSDDGSETKNGDSSHDIWTEIAGQMAKTYLSSYTIPNNLPSQPTEQHKMPAKEIYEDFKHIFALEQPSFIIKEWMLYALRYQIPFPAYFIPPLLELLLLDPPLCHLAARMIEPQASTLSRLNKKWEFWTKIFSHDIPDFSDSWSAFWLERQFILANPQERHRLWTLYSDLPKAWKRIFLDFALKYSEAIEQDSILNTLAAEQDPDLAVLLQGLLFSLGNEEQEVQLEMQFQALFNTANAVKGAEDDRKRMSYFPPGIFLKAFDIDENLAWGKLWNSPKLIAILWRSAARYRSQKFLGKICFQWLSGRIDLPTGIAIMDEWIENISSKTLHRMLYALIEAKEFPITRLIQVLGIHSALWEPKLSMQICVIWNDNYLDQQNTKAKEKEGIGFLQIIQDKTYPQVSDYLTERWEHGQHFSNDLAQQMSSTLSHINFRHDMLSGMGLNMDGGIAAK